MARVLSFHWSSDGLCAAFPLVLWWMSPQPLLPKALLTWPQRDPGSSNSTKTGPFTQLRAYTRSLYPTQNLYQDLESNSSPKPDPAWTQPQDPSVQQSVNVICLAFFCLDFVEVLDTEKF